MKYWKETVEITRENFMGTTPPALFVGRNFYPKVFVGMLAPPEVDRDAEILDFPEKWYEMNAGIDDVLKFRGRLVYSRWRENVAKPSTRFTETMQEVVMSKKPVDVELWLKHRPRFNVRFDVWATPIGNPASLKKIKVVSNPKVERRVDYVVSDDDMKAYDAVVDLYSHGIPVSRIQKLFSSGVLGSKIERKLVPLRWAITGVHDIIGNELVKKIKTKQSINEVLLFENYYVGNHYLILLIPGPYQYELIEIKYPKSVWNIYGKEPYVFSDYEPHWGKHEYADNTGGAFYAGRLGVLEYLERINKQATVLIIREVTEEYTVPVGIWQMQEAVRDAFNKPSMKFDDVSVALEEIKKKISVEWERVMEKSKLLDILKTQKRIFEFF